MSARNRRLLAELNGIVTDRRSRIGADAQEAKDETA